MASIAILVDKRKESSRRGALLLLLLFRLINIIIVVVEWMVRYGAMLRCENKCMNTLSQEKVATNEGGKRVAQTVIARYRYVLVPLRHFRRRTLYWADNADKSVQHNI
jgi:hypothetical protein